MGMTSSGFVISTAPACSTSYCVVASTVLGDVGSSLTGPPTWYHEGVVVSKKDVGSLDDDNTPRVRGGHSSIKWTA